MQRIHIISHYYYYYLMVLLYPILGYPVFFLHLFQRESLGITDVL